MKSMTISARGRVTLPEEIRTQLGLVSGTPVEFELKEDGVLLRKRDSNTHPVDRAYGLLRLAKPVDDLIDEMRGPRPARR